MTKPMTPMLDAALREGRFTGWNLEHGVLDDASDMLTLIEADLSDLHWYTTSAPNGALTGWVIGVCTDHDQCEQQVSTHLHYIDHATPQGAEGARAFARAVLDAYVSCRDSALTLNPVGQEPVDEPEPGMVRVRVERTQLVCEQQVYVADIDSQTVLDAHGGDDAGGRFDEELLANGTLVEPVTTTGVDDRELTLAVRVLAVMPDTESEHHQYGPMPPETMGFTEFTYHSA